MGTNPTSAAYFARAERYLKRNHRIALRSEIVAELIGRPEGKRILDLGCGNGAVSLPFAARNTVTLVDNSTAMLKEARRYAETHGLTGYELIQADANDVNFEPVDVILALGLLAHVQDSSDVIAAIARNLKPGGRAILQFSDATRPLNRISLPLFRLRGRRYRPTPRGEILALAASHGLKLVDERSHLLLLPGVARVIGRALLPYDRFVRRIPALARQGLDTLLLLEATQTRG